MDIGKLSIDSTQSSKIDTSDKFKESSRDRVNQKNVEKNAKSESYSVDMNILTLDKQRTIDSRYYDDKNIWSKRSSRYMSNIEKIKQLELNRNKFAFIIYRPIPSIVICLTIGMLILGIGSTMIVFSRNVDTVVVKYTEDDKDPIKFDVKTALTSPVYLYYRITNFYASHKKFVIDSENRSLAQNRCLGVNNLRELIDLRCVRGKNTLYTGEDGNKMCGITSSSLDILDRGIYPCGISSATIMTDEYEICSDPECTTSFDFHMPVDSRDTDIFTNLLEYDDSKLVWIDPMNIRLRRWNTTPFGPNFQVLYGIIQKDIPIGTYYLRIKNNTWPAKEWNAGKEVALITTSIFGDKGIGFTSIVLTLGSIYFLTGLFFLATHLMRCIGNKGETEDLNANKNTTISNDLTVAEVSDDGFTDYVEPNEERMPCLCPLH